MLASKNSQPTPPPLAHIIDSNLSKALWASWNFVELKLPFLPVGFSEWSEFRPIPKESKFPGDNIWGYMNSITQGCLRDHCEAKHWMLDLEVASYCDMLHETNLEISKLDHLKALHEQPLHNIINDVINVRHAVAAINSWKPTDNAHVGFLAQTLSSHLEHLAQTFGQLPSGPNDLRKPLDSGLQAMKECKNVYDVEKNPDHAIARGFVQKVIKENEGLRQSHEMAIEKINCEAQGIQDLALAVRNMTIDKRKLGDVHSLLSHLSSFENKISVLETVQSIMAKTYNYLVEGKQKARNSGPKETNGLIAVQDGYQKLISQLKCLLSERPLQYPTCHLSEEPPEQTDAPSGNEPDASNSSTDNDKSVTRTNEWSLGTRVVGGPDGLSKSTPLEGRKLSTPRHVDPIA
ncbi:hypothetical protein F53441_1289 [Fusarium austroafricanum]|uniref:Uncharacterized protein n=1 Tax=Fusarium austroafricanum TaxID=2364996 RepID=A0A8H4P591_9HYPO|nr:hypothetical protein F53441_1289 [Fusarium austroafricanum]